MRSGNIFAQVPEELDQEEFLDLFSSPRARIERIVSTGQASPPGFWFDQEQTEWVIVLSGAAGLRIEGEDATRTLRPGDYVELPPHVRHRVEWTDPHGPTVWLAIHLTCRELSRRAGEIEPEGLTDPPKTSRNSPRTD